MNPRMIVCKVHNMTEKTGENVSLEAMINQIKSSLGLFL